MKHRSGSPDSRNGFFWSKKPIHEMVKNHFLVNAWYFNGLNFIGRYLPTSTWNGLLSNCWYMYENIPFPWSMWGMLIRDETSSPIVVGLVT